MSKFPLAYCNAMQTYVDPDDARDICVRTGKVPVLMCPDEGCRQEKPDTKISAVCCDPKKECSSLPHFRTYPEHQHSENCPYEIHKIHTEYILSHKKDFCAYNPAANILKNIDGIDTSTLPDEYITQFAPKDFLETIEQEAKKQILRGTKQNRAYQIARCIVPQKTSRLSLVVDMALKLDKKGMRAAVPLVLPERSTANYYNAFLSIYSLKYDYFTPYIYCGVANVVTSKNGYMIIYKYSIKKYHPDYPELPAVTPIEREHYRPSFLEELSGYAASGEDCRVYSFSTHCLKENTCPADDTKRCVVIEPRTRDAVVIRDRCLKREEKRTD